MLVYRCEDSVESIFTAIYNSYEEQCDHQDTMLSLDGENYLFAEYRAVVPDLEKTKKVMGTLRRRFGEEDYCRLCMALASPDPGKAQAVYRTVVQGIAGKCRCGHLFDNLANEDVNKAFKLSRNAGREYDHMRGFLRFSELESGILYTKFAPKNNLLTFLMPHFAERFSGENFVLHDELRGLYGVHPREGSWYVVEEGGWSAMQDGDWSAMQDGDWSAVKDGDWTSPGDKADFSEAELKYRELFRGFCGSITIESRKNEKLQMSMLPLRFREYMVEFNSEGRSDR